MRLDVPLAAIVPLVFAAAGFVAYCLVDRCCRRSFDLRLGQPLRSDHRVPSSEAARGDR